MTILNRLYASSGSEIIYGTVQIDVGTTSYYLVKGWDDIRCTLENGQTVDFVAAAIDLALPARNKDGTQDLKLAIGNIEGIVSSQIRASLNVLENAAITYRTYVSTDLTAPAAKPFTLAVKSGFWTAEQVQITAGYLNVLDTAWPRYRYTLADFPGLRYIT
ncbi:ArsR family transcriptional regulator [Snodgrassella communis]|uniref:ArsR family transcriptional regulator n=1 Tax=Snodgrassella communis TaxID=2946699 RepID=A0A837AG95_9NEIS|nr:DUF1833 family protein [Snodgrassella communis]KDN14051.1 hypothetical protein SALWKB29_1953 [Snodgrassella communis]PIT10732.1 ArsR family transcriptional regulator [Snodgrassella communis]PIT28153.1 ArsR family transcriptional regulator [Snodgrassella communis]PIT30408.1 ArsR family transcriptional regulator [Snodgrassella communis]PIT37079.1 ArsR family transcriptional regulator [Snodgrassella communis]